MQSAKCLTDVISHRNCVLEHIYSGRPPTAHALIASLNTRPSPRPSILQLSDLAPPTTSYSVFHSALQLIAVASKDEQSLAILDFLYRVLDILEDFLGAPLLTSKIEDNYEIVAQLLGEMCDGGIVSNTEPNALRESVEVSSVLGQLFTKVGLPGYVPFARDHSILLICIALRQLLGSRSTSRQAYDHLSLLHLVQQYPGENQTYDIPRTSSTLISLRISQSSLLLQVVPYQHDHTARSRSQQRFREFQTYCWCYQPPEAQAAPRLQAFQGLCNYLSSIHVYDW